MDHFYSVSDFVVWLNHLYIISLLDEIYHDNILLLLNALPFIQYKSITECSSFIMPTMLVYFDNRWCTRAIKLECSLYISMGQYKRDVTPGETHWRYVFLALNHWYGLFSLNWYHCILIVCDLAIYHQPCTVYWMSAQWSEYQQSCYTDHENGHISPHQHPWQHF